VLPLRDENPGQTTPILTWLLIAACVVAYAFWQPTPFDDTADDTSFDIEHAVIPCEVMEGRPLSWRELRATYDLGDTTACDIGGDNGDDPAVPDKNVWLSIIASMFLHGSLIHIGGNLLALWVFGNNVEDVLGKVGFLLFYLVGGVVATMAHVVMNPDSTMPLVGASGAIAAVMGAYLVFFPRARVLTLVVVVPVRIRAVVMLSLWFALQFLTDPNSGVAWAAHVGGFLFGVMVGLLVRATGRVEQVTRQVHPSPR
jgi:membrane associated rhomboid family serine protease